jgi:lipopolysaccharide biosynthesis protein
MTPPTTAPRVRAAAFYLPQFHPIPENDAAWGEGFTEWTNVRRARPLFPGHRQPIAPGALGYYDLRDPAARDAQARLARAHGLSGFVWWHYWFAGRRVLETPFEAVLASGAPDFPFCLAWANQSWTGVWHGDPGRLLIAQTYPGPDDHVAHFRALAPAFRDPRYMAVGGRPIFMIYAPDELPDRAGFAALWAREAAAAGLPAPFLIGLYQRPIRPDDRVGFDAVSRLAPNLSKRMAPARRAQKWLRGLRERTGWRALGLPQLLDAGRMEREALGRRALPPDEIPCVFTKWDNTPRSGVRGRVALGASPERFGRTLAHACDLVAGRPFDARLVLVRSWNEWAEGNILEPDAREGDAWLRALARAVGAG